jgi:hypothetical protein
MNDDQQLKELEAATGRSKSIAIERTAAGTETNTEELRDLRASWELLSQRLTARDRELEADSASFFGEILASIPASTGSEHAASAPLPKQAPRGVSSSSAEPMRASWALAALAACVALVIGGMYWFDSRERSERMKQAVVIDGAPSAGGTKRIAEADKTPAPTQAVEIGPPQRERELVQTREAYSEPPVDELADAWADPVDQAIVEAGAQLSAIRGVTAWEQSVLAFEQYRQSVEREWDEDSKL